MEWESEVVGLVPYSGICIGRYIFSQQHVSYGQPPRYYTFGAISLFSVFIASSTHENTMAFMGSPCCQLNLKHRLKTYLNKEVTKCLNIPESRFD